MSEQGFKIVVCGGMVRSGSTLQYHMVLAIVEFCLNLGWIKHQDMDACIAKARAAGGYTVAKTHVPITWDSRYAGGLLASGNIVAIRGYRDTRDIAVSFLDFHPNRPWKDIVEDIKQGVIRHGVWESLGAYTSKYEDILADPVSEVLGIANHIGIVVSNKRAVEIAESLSIENMRNRVPKSGWDPLTTMRKNHIADGAVGKWKGRLTSSQLNDVLAVSKGWLIDMGYDV